MEYLADNASFYIWFLIAALVLVTMMNVVGLDISKWLHNAGAFGMWLPCCRRHRHGLRWLARFGAATRFTAASLILHAHLKDILFWTYVLGGCETASSMRLLKNHCNSTVEL